MNCAAAASNWPQMSLPFAAIWAKMVTKQSRRRFRDVWRQDRADETRLHGQIRPRGRNTAGIGPLPRRCGSSKDGQYERPSACRVRRVPFEHWLVRYCPRILEVSRQATAKGKEG